jgi:hypothetical protein
MRYRKFGRPAAPLTPSRASHGFHRVSVSAQVIKIGQQGLKITRTHEEGRIRFKRRC